MSKPKRVTFSNSLPVQRVMDSLPIGQSMASRMADIAERYEMICRMGPALTHDEQHLVRDVLDREGASPTIILKLEAHINQGAASGTRLCDALADKVSAMTIGERIAMIEALRY